MNKLKRLRYIALFVLITVLITSLSTLLTACGETDNNGQDENNQESNTSQVIDEQTDRLFNFINKVTSYAINRETNGCHIEIHTSYLQDKLDDNATFIFIDDNESMGVGDNSIIIVMFESAGIAEKWQPSIRDYIIEDNMLFNNLPDSTLIDNQIIFEYKTGNYSELKNTTPHTSSIFDKAKSFISSSINTNSRGKSTYVLNFDGQIEFNSFMSQSFVGGNCVNLYYLTKAKIGSDSSLLEYATDDSYMGKFDDGYYYTAYKAKPGIYFKEYDDGYEVSNFFYDTETVSAEIPGIYNGKPVISIADSVFNGCTALTSITFQGTKAQWNVIKKGDYWNYGTGTFTIHCTDGDLDKDGNEI